jgi:hypothetical protein
MFQLTHIKEVVMLKQLVSAYSLYFFDMVYDENVGL